jgi:signal peptidase II
VKWSAIYEWIWKMMKSKLHDYSSLILIASFIVVLDQVTKWAVRNYLAFEETWLPSSLEWLSPYARIINWYNKGAAFGTLQGMRYVFIVLTFVVIGAIIYYYPSLPVKDRWSRLAMAMLLGGAIGNLIDRVLFGQVTDFISVGTFPILNIADMCVSVSAVMLAVGMLLNEIHEKKAGQQVSMEEEKLPVVETGSGEE